MLVHTVSDHCTEGSGVGVYYPSATVESQQSYFSRGCQKHTANHSWLFLIEALSKYSLRFS